MPEMPDPMDAQDRRTGDEDAVFVARCRHGDPDAFAVLVRRHQKRMLNIAYRMIGDYGEACDVIQEAFLSAWRGISHFRGEARFSTWLCGIVLNHARNHLKQRAARSGRTGASCDNPDPPSGEESAVERLERCELETRVQEGIGSLDGRAAGSSRPEGYPGLFLRGDRGAAEAAAGDRALTPLSGPERPEGEPAFGMG